MYNWTELIEIIIKTLKDNAIYLGVHPDNILRNGEMVIAPFIHVNIYPDGKSANNRFNNAVCEFYCTVENMNNDSVGYDYAMELAFKVNKVIKQVINIQSENGIVMVKYFDEQGRPTNNELATVCLSVNTIFDINI